MEKYEKMHFQQKTKPEIGTPVFLLWWHFQSGPLIFSNQNRFFCTEIESTIIYLQNQ